MNKTGILKMHLGYIPNWDRKSTSTGYEVVYCPEHHRAWSTGYVYVHIIIAEQKIDRLLKSKEIVHHKDGNKKNNDPDNIDVISQSEHAKEHKKLLGREVAFLICPFCKKHFKRFKNQTHIVKGGDVTFCSRKCNGSFYKNIPAGTVVNVEIIENIIEIKRLFSPYNLIR